MSYRVSVKHWLLFLDSFCLFCHAFGNKNVSFADNLFLCHIFYFCFTLNCSICFTLKCSTLILQSLTVFASWVRSYGFITLSAFLLAKILKKTRLDPFCLFFVQNKFVLTKISPKWHLKSTFSVKKETVLGLSLSLDVLIYNKV